ncbi:hypothetical protein GF373_08100 [bacterium]|nr:hypothetical protein [bacterium]
MGWLLAQLDSDQYLPLLERDIARMRNYIDAFPELDVLAAKIHSLKTEWDQAREAIQHALSLNENEPSFLHVWATIEQASGNLQHAKKIYQDILSRHYDFSRSRHNLALLLYQENRIEETMAELIKTVRFDRGYSRAYSTLAQVYYLQKSTSQLRSFSLPRFVEENPVFQEQLRILSSSTKNNP